MPRVCFDHLSGAPVEPRVLEAMLPWLTEKFGGTGAVHAGGVEARAALDSARESVARFLNAASPEEIIFTSSGTEAINLAVKGCAWANQRRGKKIVLSAIDHPAVMQSVEFLESANVTATRVKPLADGRIDPAAFANEIDDETILVSVHAAHHDVGTIQDLRAIGDIAAERGIPFFVDATYAAGWMDLDVQAMNASYLAVAPHRFGGPKGVGVLCKQRRARLTPLLHGGTQELGWRAGTENIAGAVGAGVACELPRSEIKAHARVLQMRMWTGVQAQVDGVRLNGAEIGPQRLPNNLNLSFAGIEGEGLALSLDMKGFAITSGQACATKANKVPPTLAALGVTEEFAAGTVILSFGKENTVEEVDRFLAILPGAVKRLREINE